MSPSHPAPRPAAILGYGGLLPFLAGAALAWPGALDRGLVTDAFVAYSATILAFLGGLQWGVAMQPTGDRFAERLAVGVTPALVAWIALLLPDLPGAVLLGVAFAALLAWERWRPSVVLPRWYPALRLRLTVIVVLCHLLVAAARA
jgi:hypothetical protein